MSRLASVQFLALLIRTRIRVARMLSSSAVRDVVDAEAILECARVAKSGGEIFDLVEQFDFILTSVVEWFFVEMG